MKEIKWDRCTESNVDELNRHTQSIEIDLKNHKKETYKYVQGTQILNDIKFNEINKEYEALERECKKIEKRMKMFSNFIVIDVIILIIMVVALIISIK